MEIDPLEIPAFLRISAEDRKNAWKDRPYTDPHTGGLAVERRALEKERVAATAEARKLKNARGLARIKLSHPGERWDRKHKIWVPE